MRTTIVCLTNWLTMKMNYYRCYLYFLRPHHLLAIAGKDVQILVIRPSSWVASFFTLKWPFLALKWPFLALNWPQLDIFRVFDSMLLPDFVYVLELFAPFDHTLLGLNSMIIVIFHSNYTDHWLGLFYLIWPDMIRSNHSYLFKSCCFVTFYDLTRTIALFCAEL